MGWDYVTYGDRHVLLDDLIIWAVRHFLAGAAGALATEESDSSLFVEAKAFVLRWYWPGPGVVTGTELDEFVQDSTEREDVLAQVCDRAIARLREFGKVVPLAYLQAQVNADSPGGRYIADIPTASFVEAVERIRGILMAGHSGAAPGSGGM